MKLRRERGKGDGLEVLIAHWNVGGAGKGTEVEAAIEKETGERERKKMKEIKGRSVTMTKREVLKENEIALERENILKKNRKTEKVKVKEMKGGTKMKKMKGSIKMKKEMPKRRGGIAEAEVGIVSIGAEVQVEMLASIVEAGVKTSQVNIKVEVKRNQTSRAEAEAEEELIAVKSLENETVVLVKKDHKNVAKAKNVPTDMTTAIRTTQINTIIRGAKVQNKRIKKNHLKTKMRLYKYSEMDHIESYKCFEILLIFS